MLYTFMMSLMISMIFPFLKHPLSMGLMLIMQTMMISLITGMMINMFWFSYILMITMLSGMLVLFVYMASVASNEKFYSSTIMGSTIMIMITLALLSPLLVDQMKMSKIWSTKSAQLLSNDQVPNMIKLFNMHNMSITILIISYLFLTMIVISYIVNVFEGPLRSKN